MSTIPPIANGVPPVAQPTAATGTARARAAGSPDNSALWQVLTDEERAYFDSMATLGPVSYGPGGAPSSAAAAPVGQRIDVKG